MVRIRSVAVVVSVAGQFQEQEPAEHAVALPRMPRGDPRPFGPFQPRMLEVVHRLEQDDRDCSLREVGDQGPRAEPQGDDDLRGGPCHDDVRRAESGAAALRQTIRLDPQEAGELPGQGSKRVVIRNC